MASQIPRIITRQQLTSSCNDEKVQESPSPCCSHTQMCFFWLSTSLLFERKVEDKPVWAVLPGVFVGVALSSLLGSQKQTQPIKQHVNVHPTMGKRCTHKYRASREQWKMLTVKEAATQKKPHHQHTQTWNPFLFTLLWYVMLGFIISVKKADVSLWIDKYTPQVQFLIFFAKQCKETIFFTSTVSQVAVLSWTKELLTCLEPDTGGKSDFRKVIISYSKHRAAFKPWLPKAKPLLGRG